MDGEKQPLLPVETHTRLRESTSSKSWSLLRFSLVVASLLLLSAWNVALGRQVPQLSTQNVDGGDIQKYWAQYRPYTPMAEYAPPPKGCEVKQVSFAPHLPLQRHGARYPTADDPPDFKQAIAKMQRADEFKDPRLNFLRNHSYFLGADDLVPLGAEQSFEAGMVAFSRYSSLVSGENLPFVRASGSERVVDSAMNWTAGFAVASRYKYLPSLSVVISEKSNDTLQNAMCPNVGSESKYLKTWRSVFLPNTTARLNAAAPGADLNDEDAFKLMALCPLETVALGVDLPKSDFCALFGEEEWEGFEYYGDLQKYYRTGYGQELGPVQGVGYLNELLARLMGKPVRDNTQTNHTLDSSPETFPLGRSVYADFSHENTMIAIYSAMGLFKQDKDLDPTALADEHGRTWIASRMVPFSARMVVEKLQCAKGKGRGLVKKEWVRVLVNDALQPLEFCGKGNGLCTLKKFVKSQSYARHDGKGDWDKCFG
ncbi:hypothetical protein JAAARDRAFT_171559 [Jaapia argillacea MUCL 33604]|uniref:Phytase A n=1 Tax=Jaapia argillacea MUCL 33604 TaxID=933084 RepID=A0A067Q2T1_9AGAM|nr:hypothetical protein JAAARDRAFT_171559 [Jaapia argillacea MUCL 33604]